MDLLSIPAKSFRPPTDSLSQDVNDNVPFFTSSIYEASVTEGAQIGTSVLQVSAHDKDLGLNGEVGGYLVACDGAASGATQAHVTPGEELCRVASQSPPPACRAGFSGRVVKSAVRWSWDL